MNNTLDDWVSALYKKMHKAYDNRITKELDENWDEDPEDFDGLSETQLDEFVDDLSDAIVEGFLIEPDNYSILEVLEACKRMLENKQEIEGFWTYDTIANAISQLDEEI
jgi:hypothetical protein